MTEIKKEIKQNADGSFTITDAHSTADIVRWLLTQDSKETILYLLKEEAPQRTWVGLTDDDELDWEEGSSLKDLVKAIESKLREKNESREWQDLTDDEMLMIYGQKHEGKKYNLGRMVQQALKEKNNV